MMGRDKLLESVEGMPILRRQALAALTTGCAVAVTLPPGSSQRRESLEGLAVHLEDVPDAEEGMAASLRHAAALLGEGQSMGLLLPDVPGISGPDICHVLDAFRETGENKATRASDTADRPGTPLFLPHRIACQFSNLEGDTGGKALLKDEEIQLVPFRDDRATVDLDTPEAWAAWRRASGIHD